MGIRSWRKSSVGEVDLDIPISAILKKEHVIILCYLNGEGARYIQPKSSESVRNDQTTKKNTILKEMSVPHVSLSSVQRLLI